MPSRLQLPQQRGEILLLEIAQAGRRLVEEQQHGIGGERARDFDDALLAERQAARRVVKVRGEAHARNRARSLGARARFLGAIERKRRADDACAAAQVRAQRDVVEHAHPRHELHVLERAADAAPRDLERRATGDRCAAEEDVAGRERQASPKSG